MYVYTFFAVLSQYVSIIYYNQELYNIGINIPILQIKKKWETQKLNDLYKVTQLSTITTLRFTPRGSDTRVLALNHYTILF